MRAIIIHEYFGVILSMVWVVINEDIIDLKSTVEIIIDKCKINE